MYSSTEKYCTVLWSKRAKLCFLTFQQYEPSKISQIPLYLTNIPTVEQKIFDDSLNRDAIQMQLDFYAKSHKLHVKLKSKFLLTAMAPCFQV